MATFFHSFGSSNMSKRLLRYALARLELLDTDTLDMDNLDLAIGRNSVFEFRDVGVKLKKLQTMLKLPPHLKLQKAKVLLLRVTIPVDFYTSPISIEVDGVDVRLWMASEFRPNRRTGGQTIDADVVPNPVDLAQSFLDTQPRAERRQMEEALAAEAQDLGASIAVSDDGSEEDNFGTGQALSLPAFLADFLQGILDRMQVKIKSVTFQLDTEMLVDPNSTSPEPISFQIALGDLDVEGVTTSTDAQEKEPVIVPREGKRHISLNNVRAYLISEANVFSALARSPSTMSPSVTSSPAMTRNPPSRETTFKENEALPQDNLRESTSSPVDQPSFPGNLSDPGSSGSEAALGDSEDALGIPYDFSEQGRAAGEEDEPTTPRASIFHDFGDSPEESMVRSTAFSDNGALLSQSIFHSTTLPENDAFLSHSVFHSTVLPEESLPNSTAFESPVTQWADVPTESRSQPALSTVHRPSRRDATELESPDGQQKTGSSPLSSRPSSSEDLTQSQLYTHEDAESMYMSAFSATSLHPTINPPESPSTSRQILPPEESSESTPPSLPTTPTTAARTMPGGWGEEEAPTSPGSEITPDSEDIAADVSLSHQNTSPELSRTSLEEDTAPEEEHRRLEQEDVVTPKGPTRLVKEILSLRNISIYVPSLQQQHLPLEPVSDQSVAHLSQSLGRSIYPQAPDAFSVHAGMPTASKAQAAHPQSLDKQDDSLEVDLSPININFDTSLGFLLAMTVKRLTEAFGLRSDPSAKQAEEKRDEGKSLNLKVTLQEISLNFINRLGGVADTSERHLDPNAFMLDHEVLLNATLQNVSILTAPKEATSKTLGKPRTHQTVTETKINLQKFRFGYADGDIISFDDGRPMSTSVRDTFLSTGTDVGIKMMQTKDHIRVDVETLPLVVQIDLQRLDETFSWFGGLSSFLNMSASITSSQSAPAKSVTLPIKKARGVRFEAPLNPEIRSAAADNKMNLRIGGSYLELQGKDCSVSAETSAIKLVSRDEGLGIGFGMLRVSGPFISNSLAEPAITTEVSGVRLEFLNTPKENDLDKLLELILPSKLKLDNENEDEIMLDTLLRQRKKGSVLRVNVDSVNARVKNLAQLEMLPHLGEEVAKLATVAKYLPEDDRPGLLTLAKIGKANVDVTVGGQLGRFQAQVQQLEVGHITMPSLLALAVHGIHLHRNETEELISSTSETSVDMPVRSPVIMARMIGDEIEPVVKVKLYNVAIEYRVPFIMDLLGLAKDATPQDFEAGLAASVANLGDHAYVALTGPPPLAPEQPKPAKPMTLDVVFRDCLIGLNPLNVPSKMVVALTKAHLEVVLPKDVETRAVVSIDKSSVLLIDDVAVAAADNSRSKSHRRSSSTSKQVLEMCARGYVDICYVSAANIIVDVTPGEDGEKQVEVIVRDDLFVMETCADSTQTLITLVNALKPPTPESKEIKYLTEVMPVDDLLASISGEAFGPVEGEYDINQAFANAKEMTDSASDLSYVDEGSLHIDERYYQEPSQDGEEIFDAMKSSGMSQGTQMTDTADGVVVNSFESSQQENASDSDGGLVFHDDFYDRVSKTHEVAKIWNSNKDSYDGAPVDLVKRSPMRVSIKDVHFIWNLFDGYDWARTRDVITKAVHDIENRVAELQSKRQGPNIYEEEVEDEEAIGDFLFNSIYIGISANRDPQELSRAINQELNDNATETESIATTAVSGASNRTARPYLARGKRPRLQRSRHHKITFELQGISADIFAYPKEESGTQSSIDVRVNNLDVFDHVPTSTWKKFATYDQDAGEREMGSTMVHAEILNVKPLAEVAASEIVLRLTLLPLRLHVDQDALDFITRFFEFKDDSVPVHASPSDVPFIQRAEVFDIPVKLDFKPKRVDYAGLRSGHTTEFMNFITLEEARMTMRHAILYGISGFDKVGLMLNDVWMPDVKQNQLPGILAGLAPVRSLVNIGTGFRNLVEIPVQEYRKDGRVIRSIQKGATSFARTTGTEIIKLGAKLAVGTQYALQGAEGLLSEQQQQQHQTDTSWADDGEETDEDKKQISLYADQPRTMLHGMRGGYRALARDISMTRDAIIAISGDVAQSQGPGGAARAVWKRAPTIVFRPVMGVSKIVGQTLMGATNQIDPQHQRRINEKYKKH